MPDPPSANSSNAQPTDPAGAKPDHVAAIDEPRIVTNHQVLMDGTILDSGTVDGVSSIPSHGLNKRALLGAVGAIVIIGAGIAIGLGLTGGGGAKAPGSPTASTSAPAVATAAYSCKGNEVELYNNWTRDAVTNGATSPTISTNGKAYCLVEIATYHWNNGNGTSAGTLALLGRSRSSTRELGPYPAQPTNGKAQNVNLVTTVLTTPTPVIIDGSYTVKDSEPHTWSRDASGGWGFVRIWAIPAIKRG